MIVFSSEVGPDVMMFDAVAQRMMELMDKKKAGRGVVTVEQMPAAIGRLRAAVAQEKALRRDPKSGDDDADSAAVGLAQRALPLIELLELSLARNKPVMWGA